jgi:hypothetical protein
VCFAQNIGGPKACRSLLSLFMLKLAPIDGDFESMITARIWLQPSFDERTYVDKLACVPARACYD